MRPQSLADSEWQARSHRHTPPLHAWSAGRRACCVDFIQYAPSQPKSQPVHVPACVPTWRPSGVWMTPGCSENASTLLPASLRDMDLGGCCLTYAKAAKEHQSR